MKPSNEKKTLVAADFRNHPIWGGDEDDYGGMWYEPAVDLLAVPYDNEDWGMVFVYCELRLADGTKMEGVMYIAPWSGRFVYGINFFRGEEEFHFSGTAIVKGDLKHLEQWLGKDTSQISPVTFSTPFCWKDGTAIEGTIDLSEWRDPFAKKS